MLTCDFDAAIVSFHMGYGNPSQCSREYRDCSTPPPLRDIGSLQQVTADEQG